MPVPVEKQRRTEVAARANDSVEEEHTPARENDLVLRWPIPPNNDANRSIQWQIPEDPDAELKMQDILTYFAEIQQTFSGRPEVFQTFLKIIRDTNCDISNIPVMERRARQLFAGHPRLLRGIDVFLHYRNEPTTRSKF